MGGRVLQTGNFTKAQLHNQRSYLKLKNDPARHAEYKAKRLLGRETANAKARAKWAALPLEDRTRRNKEIGDQRRTQKQKWPGSLAHRKELVSRAKIRAKSKHLPFNITWEDVYIPLVCPVLGIPLVVGEGCMQDGSPTLDRICPKLGYVKGNIAVMSYKANRCKNDATADELVRIAIWLKHNSGLSP